MKNASAKAKSKIASTRRKTAIVSGIVITVAFVVTMLLGNYLILQQNTEASRDNVYTMNDQLARGAEGKLHKLEEISSRVFLRKSIVSYDASVYSHSDQYEALQKEKDIADFLESLSSSDNYNDFFFLYANNHTVGRVSKSTNETFGSDMYETVRGYLKNKQSAWIAGLDGDYERLYLVRSINSGTVSVSSMFTSEMKSVFPGDSSKNLSFLMTDDSGNVIFSVNRTDVSDEALKKLKNEWQDGEPVVIDTFTYTACSSSCGDSWHVITVTDFTARNARYLRIMLYCTLILLGAVVIVFFVVIIFSSSRMPDNIIYRGDYSSNNIDRLTGLIMNEALENVIVGKIDSCINGTTMVLLLVRIKNYDLISENYGESAVDEAMVKVSGVLREFYGKNNTVGKTGENEFAVLADFTDFNLFKAHDRMKANIRQLEEELDKLELENERGMIRCAIGAAIYPDDSDDYDVLYENAKAALDDSAQTRACKCKFFKDIAPQDDKKK